MTSNEIDAMELRAQVQAALAEDVGTGDLTADLISVDATASAQVLSREDAVVCGTAWFDEVFRQIDADITIRWQARDGDRVAAETVLCELAGSARGILTAERTALNFLQTLSGTATVTRTYADAVTGTGAQILDTRKTIPGLRTAQKYAVRCGGGHNHRLGLHDGVLIKENHIIAAGSLTQAVTRAVASTPAGVTLEVEVEDLTMLREALAAGARRILLDNFDQDTLRDAVKESGGRAKLEASGNITLVNIRAIAETGVDFISVGALTKHLHAVDLSMRFT